jgi:UPF0755 protein
MRRLGVVLVLVLGLLAAVGTQVYWGLSSLDEPLNVASPMRFKVAAGARFTRVVSQLDAQGLVPRPRAWVLYARWKGLAGGIKTGEYEIEPGVTPRELLQKMLRGDVLLHSLTIVDGWRVQDVLAAMRHSPDIVSTLPGKTQALQDNPAVLERIGLAGTAVEGQFLPETYRFPTGTSDVELLRDAHAALTRVLDAAWKGRDTSIPLHSAYELLIMSSIVQKESGVPAELPKIAGLYLHRLDIGMRLQADPTVIYGLGDSYDGTIHPVELRTDGPYNSYTRAGLPPTPIALVSAAVIAATAHPEKTDALYFVASGRGDGSHVFSATLDQQNAAVAQSLAKLRQRAAAGAPQ